MNMNTSCSGFHYFFPILFFSIAQFSVSSNDNSLLYELWRSSLIRSPIAYIITSLVTNNRALDREVLIEFYRDESQGDRAR